MVVVSDLYDEPEAIAAAIGPLRYAGHDVIVFHVLDPAEIDFSFGSDASFVDLESGDRMPVVPEALRRSTATMVNAHIAAIGRLMTGQPHRLRPVQHVGAARPRVVPLPGDA